MKHLTTSPSARGFTEHVMYSWHIIIVPMCTLTPWIVPVNYTDAPIALGQHSPSPPPTPWHPGPVNSTCAQWTSTDPPLPLASWMNLIHLTRSASGMEKDVLSSQFISRKVTPDSLAAATPCYMDDIIIIGGVCPMSPWHKSMSHGHMGSHGACIYSPKAHS